MLMCYLKTCPFTKPIGSDCTVERIPGMCCPIIRCPEVPVMIPEAHPLVPVGRPPVNPAVISVQQQPHSPTTTALSIVNVEKGCHADNQFFTEGSLISSETSDPCDLCYCIRNHTACVKQRCVLEIPGCTPQYKSGHCCPVGYDCDGSVTFAPSTTTTTTTTTTTQLPITGCYVDDKFYYDGSNIETGDSCNHCYCLKGKLVCAIQECDPPVHDKCVPILTNDHCCPHRYNCSSESTAHVNSDDYETTVEALATTPEIKAEGEATDAPQLNIHETEEMTTLPPLHEEAVEAETTALPRDEEVHQVEVVATTLESESGLEEQSTTGHYEEDLLPEERIKLPLTTAKPSESVSEIPVVVLSPKNESFAATAVPETKDQFEPTEGVVEIETTVKPQEDEKEVESTTSLLESDVATNQPLPSHSFVLEESSTKLPPEVLSVDVIAEDDAIITTAAPFVGDIDVTKSPAVASDDLPQKNRTDELEVVEMTSAPHFIEPEAHQSTTIAAVEDSEVEKATEHVPDEIRTTESPEFEVEATTTIKEVIAHEPEIVTTEESINLETTVSKEEDDELNLVEEPTKIPVNPSVLPDTEQPSLPEIKPSELPEVQATELPEIKQEIVTTLSPEQKEDDVVATTEVPSEQRIDVTDSSVIATHDEIPRSTVAYDVIEDLRPTTEAVSFDDATTVAKEEPKPLEVDSIVTEAETEVTTEAVIKPYIPVTQSDAASHLDVIPGEGDCLQDGVTYHSGASLPSIDICQENCKCNNSVITCDKIRCEKPALFRHLTCTEVFEDKSCCPRYICSDSKFKEPAVLDSGSLVTDAPVVSDEAPSTAFDRIDDSTASVLELTTEVPEEKEATTVKQIVIKQTSTLKPEILPEPAIELTTVSIEEITSKLPEHQPEQPIETTKKPIDIVHDVVQEATTESVIEDVDEATTSAAVIDESFVPTTQKLEAVETPQVPLADSPSEVLPTTEQAVKEHVVEAEVEKYTTKVPEVADVELATTAIPFKTEELETTIKQDIATEMPEIKETVSSGQVESEQSAQDRFDVTTEVAESVDTIVNQSSDEKPKDPFTPEPSVQIDELPTTPAVELVPEELTTVKTVDEQTEQSKPVVEEEEVLTTLKSPTVDEVPLHDGGFVTEEVLSAELNITATEKPQQENPTTRLSISVEVVAPEATTKASVDDDEVKINETKVSSSTVATPEPIAVRQQPPSEVTTLKPAEQPIETSPVAVTPESSIEDDDPRQTVESLEATTAAPPKVDEEINEIDTTPGSIYSKDEEKLEQSSASLTEAPVEKLDTTTKVYIAEVTTKKEIPPTTVLPIQISTSLPDDLPAVLPTVALIPESQVIEDVLRTTTLKDEPFVPTLNETTSAKPLPEVPITTTILPPSITTSSTAAPIALEPVSTAASLPHLVTSHTTSAPTAATEKVNITVSTEKSTTTTEAITTTVKATTTTEATTTTTEKATITTTVPTSTHTPIPSLNQHLPAADKESVGEDDAPPDHHVDYEDHTDDYYHPDIGIPITSANFTIEEGDCVYESHLYKSAQQIPREDPCDFCFCFRGDIICLQQSCPPPIDGCYEEAIPGFCCPRFECPITAVTVNVSDAKVPYPVSASRYRSARAVPQMQVVACEFRNQIYSRGETIKQASSPCMDCLCGENGTMKCTPKKCQLDPLWHSLHAIKKNDKIDIKRAGRNWY
ncbi:hypothetical protein CHUAL_004891 [Chamberlinius hualienensis]